MSEYATTQEIESARSAEPGEWIRIAQLTVICPLWLRRALAGRVELIRFSGNHVMMRRVDADRLRDAAEEKDGRQECLPH